MPSRVCWIRRSAAFTLIELLVCMVVITLLCSLVLPAVQISRESARRASCRNNLFNLGMALHNYHDAHSTFPPGYVSAVNSLGQDIGPGWGWGAMILPFLDKNVFDAIDFALPISHDVNQTAVFRKLEVFNCPSDITGVSFVANFGRGDLGKPDSGDGVFFRNSRIRLRDIEDGALTILVGERSGLQGAANWVGVDGNFVGASPSRVATGFALTPWHVLGHTGPVDGIEEVHGPNEKSACPAGFGSRHPNGAQFLFVDGSVRFVANHVNPGVFAGLATRAGGEIVSATDF